MKLMSPITAFRRIRIALGDPDQHNLYTVPKFAAAHKEMLIIVADPQSDRIFATHKGRFVNGRIRSARGRATHIVRDMLKHSQFREDPVEAFIVSLVDTLKLPLPKGNQFYSFIDGAIFNLAKQLRADKKAKKMKKADRPPASHGVRSPIKAVDGRPEGDI